MTSELRSAVEVWDDAIAAWAADTIDTRQAAAAVIQAYGEAVRAPLLAEIERLNALADEQARYANVKKDEVRVLTAELAKFKALAETLAGALDEWVFRYYWRHEGMNTEQARIYAKAQTEMMLRQYKEARDA